VGQDHRAHRTIPPPMTACPGVLRSKTAERARVRPATIPHPGVVQPLRRAVPCPHSQEAGDASNAHRDVRRNAGEAREAAPVSIAVETGYWRGSGRGAQLPERRSVARYHRLLAGDGPDRRGSPVPLAPPSETRSGTGPTRTRDRSCSGGGGSTCAAGWSTAGEGQGSRVQGSRGYGGRNPGLPGGSGSGQPSPDDARWRTYRGQHGCSVIATLGKSTARMASWRATAQSRRSARLGDLTPPRSSTPPSSAPDRKRYRRPRRCGTGRARRAR
jgi:hypothetical protein